MNGWSLAGKESMKLSLRSKETWKINPGWARADNLFLVL